MMRRFILNQSNLFSEKRGFTLLELLISISLLGLVMVIIYSSFFQISNYSSGVKSTLELREELRLLMKIVLDDLQNIQYLKNFPETENQQVSSRETGLIAERIIGPKNTKTSEIREFSIINFHSATNSLFSPERRGNDPGIHEIGFSFEKDSNSSNWNFIRREDFYIDRNLKEGGKTQVISRSVAKFDLEFLESETALAGGGYKENWTKKWDSLENKCNNNDIEGIFCLPRAIRLTMALGVNDENIVSDSQVVNICVPPCDQEIFE